MIEIQTSTELEVPAFAVSPSGTLCLFLPAHWDVNEALTFCEPELLNVLHQRFKMLFADRDHPRVFTMTGERLSIKPDFSQLPSCEVYFDRFLDT